MRRNNMKNVLCQAVLPSVLCQAAILIGVFASTVSAQTKSESIFPDSTQAIVVVSDISEATAAFDKTDLGELFLNRDISIFVDDLRDKIQAKLKGKGLQSAFEGDELINAVNGEISFAVVQPTPKKMALCMLANVKDNQKSARVLLADGRDRIQAAVKKHGLVGGDTIDSMMGDIEINGIMLPRERGAMEITVYSAIVGDWLVATDDLDAIKDLVTRIESETPKKSLAGDETFQMVMKRFDTGEDYGQAYVKWYLKPFGLAEAIKQRTTRQVNKPKFTEALKDNGFAAIKAVGGKVGLALEDHEVLSQNFIYVPQVDGKSGLTGAAEAMDFRNDGSIDLMPEPWIPSEASSYYSFSFDIKNAFVKTIPLLEDLFLPKGAVQQGLDNLKVDVQGPQVDVEKNILDNLGRKIAITTNTKLPVDTDSERLLLTVNISGDEAETRKTIDAWLAHEAKLGGIKREDYKSFTIWELDMKTIKDDKDDSGEGTGEPDVQIQPGFSDCSGEDCSDEDCSDIEEFVAQEPKAEGEKRLLSEPLVKTQVFTVAHGHLIITNSVEHSKAIIDAGIDAPAKSLRDQPKFVRINKALDDLLPGANSMRRFVRLDESYRLTYELMREGKLPESNSLLGVLAKTLLKNEKGEPFDLKVDGKLLPANFDEHVAPFLGSIGWCTKTVDDGWLITGVVVSNRDEKE